MIYFSCLLLGIGLADLVRARFTHVAATIVGAALGSAATSTLLFSIGAHVAVALAGALVIAGWVTTTSLGSFAVRKVAVAALGLLGVIAVGIVHIDRIDGAAVTWWSQLGYPALEAIDFAQALATVAVLLFMVESANIVVRTVLELDDQPAPRPKTRGRLGARRPQPETLRGGRIIGPLERLFLFALAMAGQFTAIGAIVAAKGIVRFPELSKDTRRGSNAELFLVGSFSSWALVLLAVLYVKLSA